MHPRPFQHIFDLQGRTELGWVNDTVLYTRLRDNISAELGELYAARLNGMLQAKPPVHIFLDSSELRSCDRTGKNSILRAFMANRQRIARVVILSSAEARRSHGSCMLAILAELAEYVFDRAAFDSRLAALAPLAAQAINGPRAPAHASMDPGPVSAVRRVGQASPAVADVLTKHSRTRGR